MGADRDVIGGREGSHDTAEGGEVEVEVIEVDCDEEKKDPPPEVGCSDDALLWGRASSGPSASVPPAPPPLLPTAAGAAAALGIVEAVPPPTSSERARTWEGGDLAWSFGLLSPGGWAAAAAAAATLAASEARKFRRSLIPNNVIPRSASSASVMDNRYSPDAPASASA